MTAAQKKLLGSRRRYSETKQSPWIQLQGNWPLLLFSTNNDKIVVNDVYIVSGFMLCIGNTRGIMWLFQRLNSLNERRGYWKLKEEELDRTR
jgi:hypothetical protein